MDDVLKNLKVMYTEEQIQSRIREVAKNIDKDYEGKEIIVISVLKGAVFFYS